jgi:hypothetical protein
LDVERVASEFFDSSLTPRERAIFEGGIALGAICHQFSGMPVSPDRVVLRSIERAIEKSMRLAPYKRRVSVRIRAGALRKRGRSPYYYQTLEERHLDLTVVAAFSGYEAIVRMRYVPALCFPLMYVEKIKGPKLR